MSDNFEPKVVAYCCTYCSYTAADLAGSLRLNYAPNVRIVKILCTGRIEPILLLEAFNKGADIVYVAGCALGDCHFIEGNVRGKAAVTYTKKLLEEIGIEPERLEFFHIPASEGPLFAEIADKMTQRGRELGPNPMRGRLGEDYGKKLDKEPDKKPQLPEFHNGILYADGVRD
jgi:F420-non-reducing hydrogenase iron-sulfur subunit